jgi:hypothetical protein
VTRATLHAGRISARRRGRTRISRGERSSRRAARDAPYPQVALLFRGEPNASGASPKASVWFQDLACKWHYVSPSFTHYFRLMVVHLGIIGWQYAYTDIGLDNVTRQWMRLYCPERLAADDALDLEADAGDDAPAAR